MKIYYCDRCNMRVPEEDIDSGKASLDSDDKALCAVCAPFLTPHAKKTPGRHSPGRGNEMPVRTARHAPLHAHKSNAGAHSENVAQQTHSHPHSPVDSKRKPALQLALLGAIAAAAIVGLLFVFGVLGGKSKPAAAANPIVQPARTPPAYQPNPPQQPVPSKDKVPQNASADKLPQPSGGLFGVMVKEHDREFDPEYRKPPAQPAQPVPPMPPAPVAPVETKRKFVAPAEWRESPAWKTPVDLLALADPKTGTIVGEWKRVEKGALQCNKAMAARLAIDYKLPEEYDIKAIFERKDGGANPTLVLPHGNQLFTWMMGAESNQTFAIINVGGKKFDGNPAAVRAGNCLNNNQRYTTVVEVRKDRVSAYLDGKLIVEWTSNDGELTVGENWKLPDGKRLAFGAFQSDTVFYALEFVAIK